MFREGASIALASVVFSALACVVLAVAQQAVPAIMPDLGAWIAHPHVYLVRHYRLVGGAIALEVLIAVGLAVIGGGLVVGRQRTARTRPYDSLWTVFHEQAKPGQVPVVEVRTVQGHVYRGPLVSQDADGSRADRMVVIGPPLRRQLVGHAPEMVSSGWAKVVLPLESIEEMYVGFVNAASVAQARPRRRIPSWLPVWRAVERRSRESSVDLDPIGDE